MDEVDSTMSAANQDAPCEWLSYEQATAYTGFSRTTLWRIANNPRSRLVVARVESLVRINRRSLDDYLHSCASNSAA